MNCNVRTDRLHKRRYFIKINFSLHTVNLLIFSLILLPNGVYDALFLENL